MARVNNLTNFLTDVASAIKQKTGDNTAIPAADFDTEILSIETVGNYQTKSVSITDNGNYSISPDENYDAMDAVSLSVNVAASEDLNAVLTAQEQKLSQLDEIINRKMSGNNMSLNIFVQPTEPTTKKGLWLQTNHTYENIILDENVYYGDEWESSASTPVIPYNANAGSAVNVGNEIYVFGGASQGLSGYADSLSVKAYKYNLLTDTWTQLTDIPFNYFGGGATSVGTDIYLFGGKGSYKAAYKYDTLTDTYTQLANNPNYFFAMPVIPIGTDIYLLGTNNSQSGYTDRNYKYNTLTNTYSRMADIPFNLILGVSVSVGTDIYLFGGGSYNAYNKNYKYDTLTNTYTQLTNAPRQLQTNIISAVNIGTDIYLFVEKSLYKYNIPTDTWTQLDNPPHYEPRDNTLVINGDIYCCGYGYNNTSGTTVYSGIDIYRFNDKTYQTDNSLIIAQGRSGAGKTYNIGYATELVTINTLNTPLLYGLVDAWFYTTQGGLDDTIPTYYGDGTQWVNFKNPIQGGNE